MMMIGEQPGDSEDKEGHPFVGPAGKLLDGCLQEAGIDRKTSMSPTPSNISRGKLRIHERPSSNEIFACRPWLDAELEDSTP